MQAVYSQKVCKSTLSPFSITFIVLKTYQDLFKKSVSLRDEGVSSKRDLSKCTTSQVPQDDCIVCSNFVWSQQLSWREDRQSMFPEQDDKPGSA